MKTIIDKLYPADWDQVRKIFAEGIETGDATFETKVPEWDDWHKSHLSACRLVVRNDNKVIAWAALSPVSERCVYGGVAEVSIYVSREAQGKGVGKTLLSALIAESEKKNIWTLQAGIFPENKASLKLHLKCGFREVGLREKLGQLDGLWRDVILLERRSRKAGIV
jgi:phosphinothricin acetyltransferase